MKRCVVIVLAQLGIIVALLGISFPAQARECFVDGQSFYGPFMQLRDNSSESPLKTKVGFTSGPKELTVEIRCLTDRANNPSMAPEKGGPWDCGESCELFLDTSGEGKVLLQLAAGLNGSVWDRRYKDKTDGKLGWTTTVKKSEKGYVLVYHLPWAALGVKAQPEVGAHWRFNVGRNIRMADGDVYTAFAPSGVRYDDTAKFADLRFGAAEAVAKADRAMRVKALAEFRAELKRQKLEGEFAARLKAFEDGAPERVLTEMKDEYEVAWRLAALASAKTNLWPNGSCEEAVANVKSSQPILMKHVMDGWKFDFGPVAFFPKGWWPSGDLGELRVIDARDDDSLKPFVHRGKSSFYLAPVKPGPKASTGVYNNIFDPKPGKYEISFWTKGKGSARLLFANYSREKHVGNDNPGLVSKPSDDWVETRLTAEIGCVPGCVRMSPCLIVTGGGIYFDDFSMVPVE